MTAAAKRVAEAILPDPFKRETGIHLEQAADILLRTGFDEEQTTALLTSVVDTIRGEYGE